MSRPRGVSKFKKSAPSIRALWKWAEPSQLNAVYIYIYIMYKTKFYTPDGATNSARPVITLGWSSLLRSARRLRLCLPQWNVRGSDGRHGNVGLYVCIYIYICIYYINTLGIYPSWYERGWSYFLQKNDGSLHPDGSFLKMGVPQKTIQVIRPWWRMTKVGRLDQLPGLGSSSHCRGSQRFFTMATGWWWVQLWVPDFQTQIVFVYHNQAMFCQGLEKTVSVAEADKADKNIARICWRKDFLTRDADPGLHVWQHGHAQGWCWIGFSRVFPTHGFNSPYPLVN